MSDRHQFCKQIFISSHFKGNFFFYAVYIQKGLNSQKQRTAFSWSIQSIFDIYNVQKYYLLEKIQNFCANEITYHLQNFVMPISKIDCWESKRHSPTNILGSTLVLFARRWLHMQSVMKESVSKFTGLHMIFPFCKSLGKVLPKSYQKSGKGVSRLDR